MSITNLKITDFFTVVMVFIFYCVAIIALSGCVQGDFVIYKAPVRSCVETQPTDSVAPKGATSDIIKGVLR